MRHLDHEIEGSRCAESSATWPRTEQVLLVLRAALTRSFCWVLAARGQGSRRDTATFPGSHGSEAQNLCCRQSCHMASLQCLCCCLVAKLCLTLCNPMDCSPPGSSFMGLSRQEYWSGLPFPPPGLLPTRRSNPRLQHWQADSLPLCHLGSLWFYCHLFSAAENCETGVKVDSSHCLYIPPGTFKWSVLRFGSVKKWTVGVVCFCIPVILSLHLS